MPPSQFILIIVFFCVNCYTALEFVPKKFLKPSLQVTTSNGVVQGTRIISKYLANGFFYAYMGIPYAQPPIGSLRFRAPTWARKWSGVLDASKQRSDCVGFDLRPKNVLVVVGNEDCLFIHVFTNENPNRHGHLKPVMVFIYGGAFAGGTNDIRNWGPDHLLSRDIVMVHLNYRLNVFGFLSTEDLASPGNYGLKDQNLALRWIQRNIKKFGGDPNNVTLFGQSAGAASIHFHMLSPKSSGLFHRAILQSGTSLSLWAKQRRPLNIAYLLGIANGITNPHNTSDLVNRLRKIDVKDFRETLLLPTVVSSMLQTTIFGLPWAPVVEPEHDDAFITSDSVYTQLENGNFNRVPVIIGYNKNETLFVYRYVKMFKPLLGFLDFDLPFLTPISMNIQDDQTSFTVGSSIRDFYNGPNVSFMFATYETIFMIGDDMFYVRPIFKTIQLMSKYVPTYFFCFSYEGKLGLMGLRDLAERDSLKGTSHIEELFYLFNDQKNKPIDETDIEVRNKLVTLWTNFAKFNNPTPESSKNDLDGVLWPQFVSEKNDFLDIDRRLIVKQHTSQENRLKWWEMMFEKFAIPPFSTY